MKNVVDTRNVAHLWAHKTQPSARNGHRNNFYFEGDTIYSYGSHFPIARHITNKKGVPAILFTTRKYSVTTAKHLSLTRNAIPDTIPVFYVGNVHENPTTKTLDAYQANINSEIKATERAKSHKQWKLNSLQELIDSFTRLASFIGSDRTPKQPSEDWFINQRNLITTYEVCHAEKMAEKEKHREERLALQRIEDKDNFESWLAGGSVTFPNSYRSSFYYGGDNPSGTDYLRIEGDEVVTSQAARVPIEHVKRIVPLVLGIIERGETYQHNGHSIHLGEYVIESIDSQGTLKVGCHRFNKDEVLRFAEILKEC